MQGDWGISLYSLIAKFLPYTPVYEGGFNKLSAFH